MQLYPELYSFAIREWPHRQLEDADDGRKRRRWVNLLTAVKDHVLPVDVALLLAGFLPVSPFEPGWESVCIHEDQLEGIPISVPGVFPSVVLFCVEGMVLFRLSESASSVPLCVCVSVYLSCTEAFTRRLLNKSHPTHHTLQRHTSPSHFFISLQTLALALVFLLGLTPNLLTDGVARLQLQLWLACKLYFLMTEGSFLFTKEKGLIRWQGERTSLARHRPCFDTLCYSEPVFSALSIAYRSCSGTEKLDGCCFVCCCCCGQTRPVSALKGEKKTKNH